MKILFIACLVVLLAVTIMSFKTAESPSTVGDATAAVRDCQLDESGIPNIDWSGVSTTSCSFSIEGNAKDAVLTLHPEKIVVTKDGKEVASLACGDMFEDDATGSFDCMVKDQRVSFQDITRDGYRDMELKTMCGAYQCGYTYYIFNSDIGAYEKSDTLSDLVSPYFDPASHTIVSSAKGRGLGDIFTITTHALQPDGTYLLTDSCSQDVLDFGNPESDYIYVCMKWDGAKMSTTSSEIVPHEEVFGDME